MTLTVGLLAGEASGDNLGAGMMAALRSQAQDTVRFVGVGGPRMLAEGLESYASIDELQVNGFREPILRLPQLYRLLKTLERKLLEAEVDVFVGVDFNVFNFLLEARLKRRGIRTAHYVSPSVYAWRSGRVRRVEKSADVLLCLYPFEPDFYTATNVQAVYVGHPLADEISPHAADPAARAAAREDLGIDASQTVLAVLPGSRGSEVALMIERFLGAAQFFGEAAGAVKVVIPCLRPVLRAQIEGALAGFADLDVVLYDGHARSALTAADVALVKSGTSTLEAMLLHRPMVVSYALGPLAYQIARRLVRSPFVALPNILAGRALVPELLQDAATPQALADALQNAWREAQAGGANIAAFEALHAKLRQGADENAARAVLRLAAQSMS